MSKGVSGHIEPVMMELTAAGLHGIFTRFPNPLRREVTPFFANGQHPRRDFVGCTRMERI